MFSYEKFPRHHIVQRFSLQIIGESDVKRREPHFLVYVPNISQNIPVSKILGISAIKAKKRRIQYILSCETVQSVRLSWCLRW